MDASTLGQTQKPNHFAAIGASAAVSAGVRQALALIDGAVETVETVRREAQLVQRRVPPPFAGNGIDIRAADGSDEDARPAGEEAELRSLGPTGVPAAETAEASPRGRLVDVEA